MSRRSSRWRSSCSRSLFSTWISSGALMGFKIYSDTPMLTAWRAYSKSSKPEKTTSRAPGREMRSLRQSSRPSKKGILMSVSTTSGRSWSASSRASSPLPASPTSRKPREAQSIFRLMPVRISSSSSASRTRYSSMEVPSPSVF